MYNIEMNKKTLKTLIYATIFCILYISTIYFFQDKFLFDPDTNYKNPQAINTPEFKENPLTFKDGTQIMTWFFQGEKNKPLILFFHGNTGQIAKYAPMMTTFTKQGYSVAMLEYRGFGNTKERLTQEKVFFDAVEFYDYYKNKTENKIIFYGYSFGCAVVMGLTQFRQPDGIILTAPFSSFYQVVKDKYYVPFAYCFIKDKYPSDEYIKAIASPIIFIHGKADSTISYKHSQKLFDLVPITDKETYLIEDINHHDIYFKGINTQIIQDWLQKNY